MPRKKTTSYPKAVIDPNGTFSPEFKCSFCAHMSMRDRDYQLITNPAFTVMK